MFIPLHVKSDCSLGYGTASVDELAERAAALGYRTLALTDVENMYGQVRFHHRCRDLGIRGISGIELRPRFDGKRIGGKKGRLVLLAADAAGYRSLCGIVSRRRTHGGETGDPVPPVLAHAEGLFAFSDDAETVERLAAGGYPRDRLGMLLVRPATDDDERERREAAARLGLPLVADLDLFLLEEGDHRLHLLQAAIRTGRKIGDPDAEAEPEPRFLRPPHEAALLFADIPEAVEAAEHIARQCTFRLDQPLHQPCEADAGASEELRKLCLEGGGKLPPAHAERLESELSVFRDLGFSRFMLRVATILAHCRREGIPVTVRGSAVSSLALHLLGGSPIDPLEYGLLFERFLHRGKSAWPDVDIDLPWHRRDEVIDSVYGMFGRDRAATVAATNAFRLRSALSEGLKAFGTSQATVDRLTDLLPPEDSRRDDFDLSVLADAAGDAAPLLPLIRRLVGRPRHVAAHPGGVVIGERPLDEILPLERAQKGVVITQFDAVAIDRLGLVKIDLLGNRCLSEIEETLVLAGHRQPLRLDSIAAEDTPTLKLIDRAETVGCFQLESPAMRSLLARLPVTRRSDLVAALALIRPGAAAGEAKSSFVRRARGEEPPVPSFPLLAERTAETHGLLLYEEDIMLLLSRSSGITLAEADELRAAIIVTGADSAALARLEERFLTRARERLGTPDIRLLREAWKTAAKFAAYSFNKAHAASYAGLAYLSAYAKVHHPVEFTCALLNHHQGLYPLRTVAWEMVRRGVTLLGPHVNRSQPGSRPEAFAGGIGARIGLERVKGLSRRTLDGIVRERASAPFVSVSDLLRRTVASRAEMTALILCGACDGLPPLDAGSYPFAHEAAVELLRQKPVLHALDDLVPPSPASGSDPARVRLYASLVRVRNELRFLEMHVTVHPVALLRDEASRYGCVKISETPAGIDVRLAATIAAMRRIATGRGIMQFVTLEDETGLLEGTVLPGWYRRMGERIRTPGPFLVEGKLRLQEGGKYLEIRELVPFHQRRKPFSA